MKAKNKAKELVDKFIDIMPSDDRYFSEEEMYDVQKENSKQCALICVDEVLESLEHNHWQNLDYVNYYKEVKQEINKL